jgi:hypothetical protein
MPGYAHVGYFDPVDFRAALVCDDCGALVHPAARGWHDEFHAAVAAPAPDSGMVACVNDTEVPS